MIPRANIKAMAISQEEELLKAVSASSIGTSLVSTMTVKPISVTAAIGSGCVMQAAIVAIKIAIICQAATETPAGRTGAVNQISSPIINGAIKPLYLTFAKPIVIFPPKRLSQNPNLKLNAIQNFFHFGGGVLHCRYLAFRKRRFNDIANSSPVNGSRCSQI